MTRMNNRGFTIVELVIATSVFATVLLLCSVAVIQISRVYYKGVTATRTQRTAVAIVNELSQSIQFGGGNVVTGLTDGNDGSKGVCVAGKRYSFAPDKELVDSTPNTAHSQTAHAFMVDSLACTNSGAVAQDVTASPTGEELLQPHMRVKNLTISTSDSVLYTIDLVLVYGDNDVLNNSHDGCLGSSLGGQFCATSHITTTVARRIP